MEHHDDRRRSEARSECAACTSGVSCWVVGSGDCGHLGYDLEQRKKLRPGLGGCRRSLSENERPPRRWGRRPRNPEVSQTNWRCNVKKLEIRVTTRDEKDESPVSVLVEEKTAAGAWNRIDGKDLTTNDQKGMTLEVRPGQRVVIEAFVTPEAVYDHTQ